MGSIGSLLNAKELQQTYQPLLLCEFDFNNGTFLRVSTHALSDGGYNSAPATGSFQYGGNAWIPRVLNQDISASQAMSDLGVDIPPQVQVVMADPDKSVLTKELNVGFKGAILRIYAVMWDAGNFSTGSFSSDSPTLVKFIGTCSAATGIDEETVVVSATSLLNMAQQQMPPQRIQPLCPHLFPPNAAARFDGANNQDSQYFACGYSPDQVGGVGNYQSGTASFTDCGQSFADCVERLGNNAATHPILQDTSNRATGRYGGMDYIPKQNNGLQRSYVTGQWELIINATNEARYGDYVPLCYGTTWVEPEVMGIFGDANYTWVELLLCATQVGSLITLVVNGDVVPHYSADATQKPNNYIPSPTSTNSFKDNYWVTVNNGSRNGNLDMQPGWGGAGDPYGSSAAINAQLLNQLAASNTIPQVQALIQAGNIRVYTTTSSYTYQYSTNPAWVLLDILINANWRYTDINIQSFIDAATFCDTQIYFNSIDGSYQNYYNESGSPPYRRFSVGFTVKQRTSIGELVRGVRNAMRGMLYFDFQTGLLTLRSKGTLADQQPSPISGSNYNTPVASVTASGSLANGYVAYKFDENSILKDRSGKSTLKISQKSVQESPNKVTNYFFDRENQYGQDISTIIDVEDVDRVGAEVVGNFNLVGPQTFDHVNRVTNTWFSENYRGNPRLNFQGSAIGDTGGTIQFDLMTSIKGVHLMLGHICLISDVQSGITNQLARVVRIQPSTNFETVKITLWWHNDNWYQDTYGQGVNQPIYVNPMSGADQIPRSWLPGYEAPQTGDAYSQSTQLSFGIAQNYSVDANGNSVATIAITGVEPVNQFLSSPLAPQLELVGVGTTGGGYPQGTAYFAAVSAQASDGSLSPLSNIVQIQLSGLNDALEFVAQSWPATATGYVAYAGFSPQQMSFQTATVGTPSLIQLKNTYNYASYGVPDQSFSKFVANVYEEVHAGVWGSEVVSVTTASITVATYTNYGFTTNEWAGREIQVLGIQWNGSTMTYTPVANFPVSGNNANTLFLSAGNPTTCVYGGSLKFGDAVVMRMKPSFGSNTIGNYFEDSFLVNQLNTLTEEMYVGGATNTSPVVITVVNNTGGNIPFVVGDFVVVQDVGGNSGANGGFSITAVNYSTNQVTLASSTGTGAYTGGGTIAKQVQGLTVNGEVGNVAFVIAGTGKGTQVKITRNTDHRFYISGSWPVTPDNTTRIVVLDPAVNSQLITTSLNNTLPGVNYTYQVDVTNFHRQAILVQVTSQSPSGQVSTNVLDPFREIFLFGSSAVPNQPYYTITQVSGTAVVDFNNVNYGSPPGVNQRVVLPCSFIGPPQWTDGTINPGLEFTLYLDVPPSGSVSLPSFAGGAGGFSSDTATTVQLSGQPNSRTSLKFKYHPEQLWMLESQSTANSLT